MSSGKRVKSIIFDVDGTLVDSVDLHAKAWQEAFAAFGHRLDFPMIRSQIGKGGDQLMPVFLSRDELDRCGEALEKHRAAVLKERYLEKVKGFPSVRALFKRILADGKTISLASSAKGKELGQYKELAGVGDLPLTEAASDDVEVSKPHPDIFEAALSRLKVGPLDALAIGDTPYDAEAAARAGVRSVGVLCGGWSEAELRDAGCLEVYADPADILARYDGSLLAT